MTAWYVLALLCVAAAVWALPDSRDVRLGRDLRRAAPNARRRGLAPAPALGIVGLSIWVTVGGARGLILALAIVCALRLTLSRLETRAGRLRRRALQAQLPAGLDLMAACLRAGCHLHMAVAVVAASSASPLGEMLTSVDRALRLGADMAGAWDSGEDRLALVPVRQAVARAADSGAALATQFAAVAEDLRAAAAAAVLVRIRGLGVRLTAPLAAAFLPAFVLLGVIPVIASLITSVLP